MIVIDRVLGNARTDPQLLDLYQQAEADRHVETIRLTPLEAQKGRLRTTTDKGTPVGLRLERGTVLQDGDVLWMEQATGRMLVVRLAPEEVLVIRVKHGGSPADLFRIGLQLGHVLGNQHWPVKVEGTTVYVPVTVDQHVMTSVLKTYGLQGIEYHFEQASLGAIPRTIPEHRHHSHEPVR
jgi:urease accessory protein